MARRVDLTGENVTRKNRKERNYGTKTDLASTVVERGSTHWASDSTVYVDGLLDVTGTLNGKGTNNFSGTNNLSGVNKLTGPTTVAGNFEIIAGGLFKAGNSLIRPDGSAEFGAFKIAPDGTATAGLFELRPDGSADFGTFGIDADGTLHVRNDLNIEDGGLFRSGVTKIEPTGKATFGSFIIDPASPRLIQAPGGWLFSSGADSIGLASSSTSSVNLNSDRAELVYTTSSRVVARSGAIDLNAAKTWINGSVEASGVARFQNANFYIPNIHPTSSPPNVYLGADGRLYATSWVPEPSPSP